MEFPIARQFKSNLTLPLHIHHVAYLMKDPPRDARYAREEFHQILESFQIRPDRTYEEKKMALGIREYSNGDKLLLLWRLHTEYYSYQSWHLRRNRSDAVAFGPLDLPDYLFPACPAGTKIAWAEILLEQREEPPGETEMARFFSGPEIFASRIAGDIFLLTDFARDENERVRYLVRSGNSRLLLEKASFIAESLSFLENYRNLILFPIDEFNQNMDRFYQLEKEQVESRESVSRSLGSAAPFQFKEWLIQLTRTLSEVTRIGDHVRYHLASAVPYDSILKATMADLNESRWKNYQPLHYFIARRVRGIADGYLRLIERVDALIKALEGSIAVLRTRVDLAMEEQNLALLKSVDETTKSQVHLQQTVEGLSVIVLTYYLAGISNYFFKGIEEWGVIHSPYLATAFFLPVSFSIAFILVYRVKRAIDRIHSGKDRPSGERD